MREVKRTQEENDVARRTIRPVGCAAVEDAKPGARNLNIKVRLGQVAALVCDLDDHALAVELARVAGAAAVWDRRDEISAQSKKPQERVVESKRTHVHTFPLASTDFCMNASS